MFSLFSVLSCGGGSGREGREGGEDGLDVADVRYSRIDLWSNPPVDETTGEPAIRESNQNGSHTGDAGETLQVTGISQGLLQKPGTRLVKQVALGDDSWFAYHALPFGETVCDCTYRVSVRTAAGNTEVVSEESMPEDLRFGPARHAISLSQWDGSTVDLVLELVRASSGSAEVASASGQANAASESQDDGASVVSALWAGPEILTRLPKEQAELDIQHERLNVLFIVADTLRADALGTWGKTPSVTPTLDALAEESYVWRNAYSSLNSTNPSFASLFTGQFAKNHGIYNHWTHLSDDRVTLAERFKDAGYKTLAVFAARHVGGARLQQGFDEDYTPNSVFTGGLAVNQAMRWLDFHGASPFFLTLHLFDAHMPHTPPMPYAVGKVPAERYGLGPVREWQQVREEGIPEFESLQHGGGAIDLYHSEVAYLDRQIDRILGYLQTKGLLDNTLVVFTADHGENLLDHNIEFDHVGLFDTTTHVPLMIRWPDRRLVGSSDALVQNLDVYPTLLAEAGLPPQNHIDALPLIGTAGAGATAQTRRAIFSEHANLEGETVRTSEYRYTQYKAPSGFGDTSLLYKSGGANGVEGEEKDISALEPEMAKRLSTALATWIAHAPYAGKVTEAELDAEALKQLEALGYVVN